MALHTISSIPQTHWDIDPENTSIEFAIGKSFLHRVRGQFHGIRGSVLTVGDQIDGTMIEAEIDAGSIDTRLGMRDGHLRDDRFLGVEHFPTISFRSTRVEDREQYGIRIFGDLTIRGITRQITLDATVEQRDAKGGRIAAHTVLDRRDFKIGPKPMGLVVGNDVAVQIALVLRAR